MQTQKFIRKKSGLIVIAVSIFLASCAGKAPNQPEKLPDDEIPAFREAAAKMSKYIVMEDSAFHFTISKEEAFDLGVSEKYYDRIQQELDYTNYLIKEEYNKMGIPIEMPEQD